MQLLLPNQLIRCLQRELRRAGKREIGGLLMGEHVHDEVFRVVDISVQRSGGNRACFIRRPKDHEKALKRFFTRTGNEYARFNYLGEWHSHPSFAPLPSETDVETMRSLAADPEVGVNFLVLLIAKRENGGQFHATATAFTASLPPLPVLLHRDTTEPACKAGTLMHWLRRIVSS